MRCRTGLFVVALCALLLGQTTTAGAASQSSTTTVRGFTTTLSIATTNTVAGRSIAASITIVNSTRRSLSYPSCTVDASLTIGLTSATAPYDAISGAVGCRTVIAPGTNTLTEEIPTTYLACGASQLGRVALACLPDSKGTPLPVGRYVTDISWYGVPSEIPHPRPLTVVLTAFGSHA